MSYVERDGVDSVILEGWWNKIGIRGLNARYLDWYEKPGGKRKGSLSLHQLFIRKDPDNISLILGETKGMKGAKEFKITSEGKNPMDRVDDWYNTITKLIDGQMDKQDHGGYKRELDIRREDSGMKVFTLSRCREINFKSLQADIGQLADDYDMQHMKAKQDAEHKEVAALGTHAQTHVQQPPPQQPSPPPQQNQQGPPPQQNQQGPPPQQNQYQNNQYQNNQYQSGQFNTPPPQQQQYQTPPPQQTFQTPPPSFQQTQYSTPPPQLMMPSPSYTTTSYAPQAFTTVSQPVFAPTFTTVGPPQNSVVCRFCGQSFAVISGTSIARCPYCQNINGGAMATTVAYTTAPTFY